MLHLRNRITVFGSLALLALGAAACMVEEDLEGTAEQAALDEAALVEGELDGAALDEAGVSDLAPVEDVGDTPEPVDVLPEDYYKPGTGPVTSSLHRGRARVGWPAAGIDICADGGGCWVCYYPGPYDKVFHQNHIVYVQAICGDAAWVRDNYGNHGMMRKDALYNW